MHSGTLKSRKVSGILLKVRKVSGNISLTVSKIPDISLTAVKFLTFPSFPDKWSLVTVTIIYTSHMSQLKSKASMMKRQMQSR